jgi:dienelactone hydrolase
MKNYLALFMAWMLVSASPALSQQPGTRSGVPQEYTVDRSVAHAGFDQQTCWVHARAGAIPAGIAGNDSDQPLVVMTMQKLQLSGSDLFGALHEMRSSDGAQTWTAPQMLATFARQTYQPDKTPLPVGAALAPELLEAGDETLVCDFTPAWHAASQRLLGIGHTVWYRDNHVARVRPRGIAYAVYNAPGKGWGAWQTVDLPDLPQFQNAGAGSVQRVDLPGGDILIPFYFKESSQQQYSVAVCQCRFDGHTLEYVRHGNALTVPVQRGLAEPSLTRFQGRYYLTLRNDETGYVSDSQDGLNFSPPRPWTFDDGSSLGNYNTQQHWVTHSDGLYLVYTRRGANNDHVFRHRAPLFIARVDPEKLQVIRSSEQVLVPERGARLGNFGVVDVSPTETWVTAAEWMQPIGVEKHGSDNSVHVAKLRWQRPNLQFESSSLAANQTPTGSSAESDPWKIIEPYFTPPLIRNKPTSDYRSPLLFNDGSQVRSAEEWPRRRAEILSEWQELLGHWPALITEPQVTVLATEQRDSITQHQIRFRWTPDQETTAYLLIPEGTGKRPAVVTVYYEPETAIGRGGEYRDFAWQLAQRGFVTLSIGSTEASQQKTYALYYPSLEDARVQPLSMLGYAAANAWHVLAARPEVDAERIGIVGHSFGGKWAMFAACLFDKFACAVWSDPGSVFDEQRSSVNYWEPWYLGYHAPPWRERGMITEDNPARGLYPRLVAAGHDLHELHALLAPRPFLVSGGAEDPPRRWDALQPTRSLYQLLGVTEGVAMTNRPDHSPNADSNRVIYAFFEHFLK